MPEQIQKCFVLTLGLALPCVLDGALFGNFSPLCLVKRLSSSVHARTALSHPFFFLLFIFLSFKLLKGNNTQGTLRLTSVPSRTDKKEVL